MTTSTAVKSCAKGLALGILWPAAFVYVAGSKFSKVVGETATEALHMARSWEDQAEEGISEAVDQTFGKKPVVSAPQPEAYRSVGAASITDKNVASKLSWDDAEAWGEQVYDRVKKLAANQKAIWWVMVTGVCVGTGLMAYSGVIPTLVLVTMGCIYVYLAWATNPYKFSPVRAV